MSSSRVDLHHLIVQLHGWFKLRSMFTRVPNAPTTAAKKSAPVDSLQLKEENCRGISGSWFGSWRSCRGRAG